MIICPPPLHRCSATNIVFRLQLFVLEPFPFLTVANFAFYDCPSTTKLFTVYTCPLQLSTSVCHSPSEKEPLAFFAPTTRHLVEIRRNQPDRLKDAIDRGSSIESS
ncbi:hypothetical protein PGT21_015650 [Puccinia graminis f. sp. tritici]|uniref:Uncharacterized protein n=1 Tax=Puccinia graminis f. sp. tritici TaxID=56615 RepID=A0A5B0PR36_PUCGR|nr:hypothetical protein PGT21_015650 [Puccinia graminis f. sp. tritici]